MNKMKQRLWSTNSADLCPFSILTALFGSNLDFNHFCSDSTNLSTAELFCLFLFPCSRTAASNFHTSLYADARSSENVLVVNGCS